MASVSQLGAMYQSRRGCGGDGWNTLLTCLATILIQILSTGTTLSLKITIMHLGRQLPTPHSETKTYDP